MAGKTPFPDHRGQATWGERLVPVERFREAARSSGRALDESGRARARDGFLRPQDSPVPVEGPFERIAVFGGVYSNHRALAALLEDPRIRNVEAIYCLGDLGGFGPNPECVRPLLAQAGVRVIQGNYEESLAAEAEDCNCGYTDPRDNRFARLSYDYTRQGCSREFATWMGRLPQHRRVLVGDRELLLVHGSPRRINEFLFHSTTPVAFLEVLLAQHRCAGLLCSHTGLHWHRKLPSGGDAVNVGVIGRPANDGRSDVWYALLEAANGGVRVEHVPLRYDHVGLADEMRREELPAEFIETILTGWWTTCLEILPARERAASKF